jgi:dipeptidyl aminopeptidase/acylaminoacyl peptidase
VTEVEYMSGDLKLKGWLSADAGDGRKRPAVVFLHGGWSFDVEDWRDAEPFAQAGFVLFMPTLRAENGNPGIYESFLGEVDDAIAAGRFVSSLPNVDGNVFVAGHSVGGVLTCLVAMLPSPYKAAAALDAYVDYGEVGCEFRRCLRSLRPQRARGGPCPQPHGVRRQHAVSAEAIRY